MGLDQWAWKIAKEDAMGPLSVKENCNREELYYWRKVPNLQGWMENLYIEKGGSNEFNCEVVQLDLEDLDKLEEDVIYGRLPYTEGFFFGDESPEDDRKILEFIDMARKVLNRGDCVYYDSWW